jgi:hypothetical protein
MIDKSAQPPVKVHVSPSDPDFLAAGRRPFRLDDEPPWRVDLAPDGDAIAIQLTLHHIAGDGQSLDVLARELASLLSSAGDCLPPLPYHFGDVARWQRDRLNDGSFASHLAYWRATMTPPLPRVHFGEPDTPGGDRFAANRLTRRLGARMAAALRAARASYPASAFSIFAAALGIALSTRGATTEVCIGTNVSTRTASATADMVGPFVNTAMLRFDVSPDLAAAEIVAAARRSTLDMIAYRDLPWELVLDELRREGRDDLLHAMPVMLLYDGEAPQSPQAPGVRLDEYRHDEEDGGAEAMLTASAAIIGVGDTPDGIELTLLYRRAAMSQAAAVALLDDVESALACLTTPAGRSAAPSA